MDPSRNEPGARRPSRRLIFILGGILVILAVIFALQGIVRGTGEAVGVTGAAPGDQNASPSADTLREHGEG